MVCAQRGYDCVICMAEPFSVERRRLMRMLGAKVIVTPKAGKGTGQCINQKLSRLFGFLLTVWFMYRHGHGAQGRRALREERLVPLPPVRICVEINH